MTSLEFMVATKIIHVFDDTLFVTNHTQQVLQSINGILHRLEVPDKRKRGLSRIAKALARAVRFGVW